MRGDLDCREKTLLPLRADDRLHGEVDMTVMHGEGATLARPPPVLGEAIMGLPPILVVLLLPPLPPPPVVLVVVVVRRCVPESMLSKLLVWECRDCLEDKDESSPAAAAPLWEVS